MPSNNFNRLNGSPEAEIAIKKLFPKEAGLFGENDAVRLVMRQFGDRAVAQELSLPLNGKCEYDDAVWHCQSLWKPVEGRAGCFDLDLTVILEAGNSKDSVISLVASFADWERQAYVLMPGIVYAGNRFDILPMAYPPLIREKDKFRLDMPTHMTEQPHLNKDGSPGAINLDTGYVTTPAMGFCDSAGRGFLMLTQQGDGWGNLGLTVEEDNEKRMGRFVISSPQAREKKLDWQTKGWQLRDWQAGDSTKLKVRLWFFQAKTVQVLFNKFSECRKDLNPVQPVNDCPFSVAAQLVRNKWNLGNWDETLGIYCSDEGSLDVSNRWQLGWISGAIVTLPLFQQGDELTQRRVMRELAFVFEKTPRRSGFFNGSSDGQHCYSDAFGTPHPHNMTMVRRQGDALYYGLRHLCLFQESEVGFPAAWERALRGLADAFVQLFDKHGQVGQFVDVETGELLVGGSTAGGIVPAGLTLAAKYFGEPKFQIVAEELGQFMVREFVARGLTTGGPGEALAAPDSESSYALLKSLVALYEATGDQIWADAARDMTRQFASWVVSYDYIFPPGSPMANIYAHATGSVVANTQNQHSAPGICTHSGDALFRLWRATGDEFALELLRDIVHNITQYVSRADRPVGQMEPGSICERVNLSDWEGQAQVGGHIFGSCAWPETALLLTAAEIPGVYVQKDAGRVVVFDHVEAKLESSKGQQKILIHNPTNFDAHINLFVEKGEDLEKPMGINPGQKFQVVDVPAGQTAVVPLGGEVRPRKKRAHAQLTPV